MGKEGLRDRKRTRRGNYYRKQNGKHVNETEIKSVKGCQERQGERN